MVDLNLGLHKTKPVNSVRLGLMAPMSGIVSLYGREIVRAATIATTEINRKGGVLGRPLELIVVDDGSLPETAIPAALHLVEAAKCACLIGNLLSNTRIEVSARVTDLHKIPLLNFSNYEGSIQSPYFFHFGALPNQQIDRMIPYILNRFGPKMFFAGANYEWPRGSIDAGRHVLGESGGEVVGEEYLPLGTEDFRELLQKVERSGADVFVPYFAGSDQMNLLTRFTEMGLKKRMTVVMGHYNEAMVSHLSPEVREGFFSSNTYFMSVDTEANRKVLEMLEMQPDVMGIWPKGNGILTNFGEGTYACVHAFAKAANQAGTVEAFDLCKALATVRIQSPQGEVVMDPLSQHAAVNSYLARCNENGSFTIIERFGQIGPVLPSRYRKDPSIQSPGMIPPGLNSNTQMLPNEVGIAYASPSGRIFHASPAFCTVMGKPLSSLQGRSLATLTHPRSLEQGQSLLESMLEDEDCGDSHFIVTNTSEETVQFKLMVVRSPARQPISFVAYACSGVHGPPNGMGYGNHQLGTAHLDSRKRLIYVDDAFLAIWGLEDRQMVLGSTLNTWFTDPDLVDNALKQAGPKGWSGAFTARLPNGSSKKLRASIEVLFNRKRRILGTVLTCQPLQKDPPWQPFNDALTSKTIMAVADIAIIATNGQGQMIQANQAAADMFGYQHRDLLGLSVRYLVPPNQRDGHLAMIQRLASNHSPSTIYSEKRELQGYRKDGSEFPTQVSFSVFHGHHGQMVVITIKDITEQKRAEAHLTWQATHDPLTRLPNRSLLKDRLSNALRRSARERKQIALLFIDLDGFKLINDSFGHALGDRLLVLVAERLLASVRPGDTVARFGGDEFVVVCEQLSEEDAIASLIQRIISAIRQPIPFGDQPLYATASIGVALGIGNKHTADELLRNADATMYIAKERGRDCWRIFNDQIHQRARKELQMANGLREALVRNEMQIYFQPIVHPRENVIVGAETLLRWFRQDGLVSPGLFVPVAERTGSILPLGNWVFEQACLAQVKLSKQFPCMPLYLSVNISARQLNDKNLVITFQECLEKTGADPHKILLEITESALMRDPAANRALLDGFAQLGLSLAVDDFGTGYSSLSQLMRLPVNSLKIDKAFVKDMEEAQAVQTIVSAIVKMTHALNLSVIAEGVETKGQLHMLRDLGCDSIQGYYFYKPMPMEAFFKTLAQQKLAVS